MPKFYGKVGYAKQTKTSPGVFREIITERMYTGDIVKNMSKWSSGERLNDELRLENKLSILADPYAYQHYSSIRYIEWNGSLWRVTVIDVQRPRLILTIGGVYNGQKAEAPSSL